LRKNKGSALVEMIVIIPIIIIFMFILKSLSEGFLGKFKGIQAAHYAVWEKADTRNNAADNYDPMPTNLITSNANTMASGVKFNGSTTLFNDSAINGLGGLFGPVVQFINFFGLNQNGLWKSRVDQRFQIEYFNVINRLFPGNPQIGQFIFWFNAEALLTDCWDVRYNPAGDNAQSITLNRVQNGMFGIFSGFLTNLIMRIMNFSVMGNRICDEPRVNLEAVPPPT
ncbi:MAG: hypothetical protein ACD_79C01026G0004, partial [uncultured bacterium]